MLLPKQIWKDIPGYQGLYQVSNTGKVRSLRYNKTRILKQWTTEKGYKKVQLHNNCTYKNYYTHRLVAQTFIANPNNLPEVNHVNENPGDNVVWNLEWCTSHYNVNYGNRTQKQIQTIKDNKYHNKLKNQLLTEFIKNTII